MRFYFNFSKEWPMLILMGLFIGFVVYLIISGKKNQSDDSDPNPPKQK